MDNSLLPYLVAAIDSLPLLFLAVAVYSALQTLNRRLP